jgi:hypothetical protein
MTTEVFYASEMELNVPRDEDDDYDFAAAHTAEKKLFEASKDLDEEVLAAMDENPTWDYSRALQKARRDNPNLVARAFPKKGL